MSNQLRRNSLAVFPLFFCILMIFISSCGGEQEKIVEHFPDGTNKLVHNITIEGEKEIVLRETEYYENGSMKVTGGFLNGKKNGLWTFWYENGFKWSEGVFKDGKSHGKFTIYDEKGAIVIASNYHNGQPDGFWKFYSSSGEVEKEILYENGKIISQSSNSLDPLK